MAPVAIGNATNAGLLAVRSLCGSRPALRENMEEYQLNMKKMVDGTSEKLLKLGSDKFLEGMAKRRNRLMYDYTSLNKGLREQQACQHLFQSTV